MSFCHGQAIDASHALEFGTIRRDPALHRSKIRLVLLRLNIAPLLITTFFEKLTQTSMDRLSANAKNPESLRKELVRSFANFESSFRKRYPFIWMLTLIAPVLLTAIILAILGLRFGWGFPQKVLSHSFMTFFIFGRFIILVGLEGDLADQVRVSMKPGELFAMVTYMDFMVALFVTFHMGFLFRMPYVGPKVATLIWDGKFIMDAQPWMKRMAFLGLVAFVVFPTSTTGSIGGSIFGRLLGLSRWLTVLGVLFGSVIGNAIMYAFSKQINQYVGRENYWLKIAGIVLIIGLVVLMELRYRHVKNKYLNSEQGTEGLDKTEEEE